MRISVLVAVGLVAGAGAVAGQDRPVMLDELNWIEVGRIVPDSVQTVLLPVGTLEPHGVVNNGADITVPLEMGRRLAPRLAALVAPAIPYGVTTTLDEYPGTFAISPETFEEYAYEVMRGLAANGFRNIVVLNGHGPNGAPLRAAAERVWHETDARILVTEWWTIAADATTEVYGTEGGHAGNNETAAVMAVRPDLVHPELYTGEDMATPRPVGWTAYPFPSSILLYQDGEGYPDFDQARAERFFSLTLDRMAELITGVIDKWDRAGL